MKFLKLIFVCSIFIFGACDCSYQYTVYAVNETEEQIKLDFKTTVDKSGNVEFTTSLQPGETKEIINTTEITENVDCTGTSAQHCNLVAEYINGHLEQPTHGLDA